MAGQEDRGSPPPSGVSTRVFPSAYGLSLLAPTCDDELVGVCVLRDVLEFCLARLWAYPSFSYGNWNLWPFSLLFLFSFSQGSQLLPPSSPLGAEQVEELEGLLVAAWM